MTDQELPNLTCWYLNYRRIGELLGSEYLHNAPPQSTHPLGQLATEVYFKDALLSWARAQQPRTLQQLILGSEVAAGQIFTLYTRFYCTSNRRGKRPCLRITLSDFQPVYKVEMPYDPTHLTSQSASSELRGSRRLFVLAYIEDVTKHTISARPYAIADIVPYRNLTFPFLQPWHDYLEIYIDSIDTFCLVRDEARPNAKELELLRQVPEATVKQAIAQIVGESTDRDWGGEQSDLFSSHLIVSGRRVTAAFLLKGPAKFKPLTVADLGKNGDQIYRLFQEPADLLVLQHCNSVKGAVRAHMRAFANQIGSPRAFCIIDGADTLRLLRSYRECGFKPTHKPPAPPR